MRLLFFFLLLASLISFSPEAGAQPRKLPPFRILQANGKVFNARELPMGKPVIVVYFSPDCDHCQVLLKEFLERAAEFKGASVALITFQPVEAVAKMMKEYGVARYPNMVAGTEGTSFFVRNYYRIQEIPFAALHDKNGNLVASYQRVVPLNDLSARLKRLK